MSTYISQDAIITMLISKCQERGKKKGLAEQIGVSPQYVTDILKGRRDISSEVAEKLGYRKLVLFETIIDPEDVK